MYSHTEQTIVAATNNIQNIPTFVPHMPLKSPSSDPINTFKVIQVAFAQLIRVLKVQQLEFKNQSGTVRRSELEVDLLVEQFVQNVQAVR